MSMISIVLVTYNSQDCIESCLDSVFTQDFKDYEIIVVDNASEDKTVQILKNEYQSSALIENKKNYYLSKALNQGITVSKGDFILVMNDDIILKKGFLENIYSAVKGNAVVAAVQPKVLKPDEKTADTLGINLSFFRRFSDIGRDEIAADFNKQKYIFGASAAACLYRRQALELVKQNGEYFDEDFLCISEDVDLSWRLHKKGWRILYWPLAACVHRGGISRKKCKFAQYLSMRNRYLMILKNESLFGFLSFPVIFVIYDLWRNLYMIFTNTGYFFKAAREVIMLAPKMIKKRRAGS